MEADPISNIIVLLLSFAVITIVLGVMEGFVEIIENQVEKGNLSKPSTW